MSAAMLRTSASVALVVLAATAARAQAPEPMPASELESRQAVVEQAQADRMKTLRPYVPSRDERFMDRLNDFFAQPTTAWRPYFQPAYRGGGFSPGAAYMWHVGAYNYVDARGSYSIRNYKRAEAEFVAPHFLQRRAELRVLGGWRDATQVSFYGIGSDTTTDNVANYAFQQPYGSALLTVRPTRRYLLLRGGAELSRWSLKPASGSSPSVDDVYTPATLPGLGTRTTYVHSQATVGFDWRQASGYARRGGFYGVTAHDYSDRDDAFSFRQVDYEIVQHLPILRESWVLSLRGLAETTYRKDDQQAPFFLLPSLGGGSNLRGFSSWRFRDRHSLLMQAEWRIMVNRFFDTAVFYDAGKVASRTADLNFDNLKHDYGFGVRFHAPHVTVLRIDVARSSEGTRLVFATSPSF